MHPKVAQIDCEDCKKYSYNLRTGRRNEYEVDDGKMLPVLRTSEPPCATCPKKSPENWQRIKLRWQNHLMLDFYQRYKSVPGMRSRLLNCPVTQRNIRLIERTFDLAKSKHMRRTRSSAERRRQNGR